MSTAAMAISPQLKPNKTAFSGIGWISIDVVEFWEDGVFVVVGVVLPPMVIV